MPVPTFCIEQHNGRLRRVPASKCKGATKGRGNPKKRAPAPPEWGPRGLNNNKPALQLPIPSFRPEGLDSLDARVGGRSNLEDPSVQRAQLEAAEELHQANKAVRAAAKAELRQAREAAAQDAADEVARKRQAEADDADKQDKAKRRRRLFKKAGIAAGSAALATGAALWAAKSDHPGARAIRERAANVLQEFSNDLFNQGPRRDPNEDDDGWIQVERPQQNDNDRVARLLAAAQDPVRGPLAADDLDAPDEPAFERAPRGRPAFARQWEAADDDLAAMKRDRDRPGIDDHSAYDEVVPPRRPSPPPFGGLVRTDWLLNTQEDLDAFDREMANRVRLIPPRARPQIDDGGGGAPAAPRRPAARGRIPQDDAPDRPGTPRPPRRQAETPDQAVRYPYTERRRARVARRRPTTPDDQVFMGRVLRREGDQLEAVRDAERRGAVYNRTPPPGDQAGSGFLDNPSTVRRLKLAIRAAEKKNPNAKRRLDKVKDDMLREILGRNNKLEQATRYIASLSA